MSFRPFSMNWSVSIYPHGALRRKFRTSFNKLLISNVQKSVILDWDLRLSWNCCGNFYVENCCLHLTSVIHGEWAASIRKHFIKIGFTRTVPWVIDCLTYLHEDILILRTCVYSSLYFLKSCSEKWICGKQFYSLLHSFYAYLKSAEVSRIFNVRYHLFNS